MIYDHPNSPYFDDSWTNVEVWKTEVTHASEVVDCWWELDEDNVYDTVRDFEREYPGCVVNVYRCSILECPDPRRNEILRYIEENRRDYEDISFWRNYL